MGNELLNPVAIAQESLLRLENQLVFFKYVNREYDDKFAVPGDKVGFIFNARMPVRFLGRIGDAIQPEDIRETMVPIAINRLWGCDLDISDQDLAMTIDRFGERYIEPAVAKIANMIDSEGLDLYSDVYNQVGTPGTNPTSLTTYTDAGVVLADSACPQGNMKSVVVNPRMEAGVLGFASNIFNPAKTISDQYLTGKMGTAVGFKFSMDQNVARHTVGTLTGSTPLVDGANQSGNSILLKGCAATTQVFNKGDILTFAGSNAVNPISYRDTGSLRTVVVSADCTSTGGGAATVYFEPALNADPTSVFRTVTGLPADSAVVKVFGVAAANFANITGVSSPQALAFHRDAFCLAIANLELPGGLDWSERVTNPKIGLSIRLTRGFDIRTNRRYTRLDVLGGWKTLRPELACRICG